MSNNQNNAQALPYSEMTSVKSVILDLVMNYDGFPTGFNATNKTILWNSAPEKNGFGIFQNSGAYYLKKYVSGTYKALLPIQIVYKSNPTTNKTNINSADLLDGLAEYLTTIKNQLMADGLTVDYIEQISPSFLANKDEKEVSLAVNLQVVFTRKK